LRLGPGAILVLAGEPARVLGRCADEDGVVYRCTTVAGDCEVRVRLRGDVVVTGAGARTLDADQVEAIPGPACSRPFNS
jgi:hypothetical protein